MKFVTIHNKITDHETHPYTTTIVTSNATSFEADKRKHHFGDSHQQTAFVSGAIEMANALNVEARLEGTYVAPKYDRVVTPKKIKVRVVKKKRTR